MSKPESCGPGRAPMPAAKVSAFFHHLGRTGSVTVAANRAKLRRSTLYQKRQDDEEFAERWAPGARSRRRAAAGQRPEPRPERHAQAHLAQRPGGGLGPAVRQSPAAVPAEGAPARSLWRSRQGRRQWHRSARFPPRQGRRRSAVTITSAAIACSAAVMPSAQL